MVQLIFYYWCAINLMGLLWSGLRWVIEAGKIVVSCTLEEVYITWETRDAPNALAIDVETKIHRKINKKVGQRPNSKSILIERACVLIREWRRIKELLDCCMPILTQNFVTKGHTHNLRNETLSCGLGVGPHPLPAYCSLYVRLQHVWAMDIPWYALLSDFVWA